MRKAHINKQFTLRLRSIFCISFSKKAHFYQKRECINMQNAGLLCFYSQNSAYLVAPCQARTDDTRINRLSICNKNNRRVLDFLHLDGLFFSSLFGLLFRFFDLINPNLSSTLRFFVAFCHCTTFNKDFRKKLINLNIYISSISNKIRISPKSPVSCPKISWVFFAALPILNNLVIHRHT